MRTAPAASVEIIIFYDTHCTSTTTLISSDQTALPSDTILKH